MPKTDRDKHPKCKHCGRTLKPSGTGWIHKRTGQIVCTHRVRVTVAEPKQV